MITKTEWRCLLDLKRDGVAIQIPSWSDQFIAIARTIVRAEILFYKDELTGQHWAYTRKAWDAESDKLAAMVDTDPPTDAA